MRTSLDFPSSTATAEVLTSVGDFVDRLESLTTGSASVCVLDRGGLARRLAAAPAFLGSRCAPRAGYRHIANVTREHELRELVCLIRRSAEAEKGAYVCVHDEPALRDSTSFCLVERDDGFHMFLVHEIGDRGPVSVVRVRDPEVGRLTRHRFERLWEGLTAVGGPLFDAGRLDPEQEARLTEACAAPAAAPAERLRTAA